jgi:hypothetical protein
MFECPTFARGTATSTHESNGVHFDEQRGGTTMRFGLGIKNVRSAKREVRRVHSSGMLVQQVAQIRGRLRGARQRQQHDAATLSQFRGSQLDTKFTIPQEKRPTKKIFEPENFSLIFVNYQGSTIRVVPERTRWTDR